MKLLEGHRTGDVVQADDRQFFRTTPIREFSHRIVMPNVLVTVGDHCTASIPALTADDVDFLGHERIGGSNDGADIEIVLEVLDGDVKWVTLRVEVIDDRL